MPKKKILVTGSVAYDLLLSYDGSFIEGIDPAHLDKLSLGFVAPRFAKHHGGTGANIAWNLKLVGQNPLLVSTVGNDGGAYTALLEERGIDTTRVEVRREHATATAIIATDEGERQITFYHPGADSAGEFPDLQDDREDFALAVIAPRDHRMMSAAATWCRKYGVPYLFDPGQQVLQFKDEELLEAIEGSAGVIANAYEWGLLSKKTSFSAEQLLEHAPMLIITQAEQGLMVYTPKKTHTIAACSPSAVVNPTGAGDALRAGLLTGLAHEWSLENCARLGASLASFVVEQEGTLLNSLDVADVWSRAEQTYSEKLPKLK